MPINFIRENRMASQLYKIISNIKITLYSWFSIDFLFPICNSKVKFNQNALQLCIGNLNLILIRNQYILYIKSK